MNKTIWLDIPATAEERVRRSDLAAEVERRKDAVIDAAVAWHQSGREGDETWFDKAEVLGVAIDRLLELSQPEGRASEDV